MPVFKVSVRLVNDSWQGGVLGLRVPLWLAPVVWQGLRKLQFSNLVVAAAHGPGSVFPCVLKVSLVACCGLHGAGTHFWGARSWLWRVCVIQHCCGLLGMCWRSGFHRLAVRLHCGG